MAIIKLTNRGYKEIYLTRYFNSLESFNPNKDNVGFNESDNSFSDYCFEPSCSTWQNDKIKILSLPNKGKLFYLTNPGNSNPIYANVFIGQLIIVRDLIDNKILKFNAEGSFNNQFTGNYLTDFNIERFCGVNSNNIIANVKLNMIDIQVEINQIYNISIPTEYTSSGWEGGHTGGTAYLDGFLEFTLGSILNTSSGYIRLKVNGNNNELGLQRVNNAPIIINEVLSISEQFRELLYSSCSNVNPCMPEVETAEYVFEYSMDKIAWTEFKVRFNKA